MYARKLTKEELLKDGITNVTEDGHVYKGDIEVLPFYNQKGYFMHNIFELDENGQRVRIPREKSAFGYIYKQRTIGLHRLMWAWFYDEVPEGMVVDHINNEHDKIEDYYLSNLQLLTPAENLKKEREESTKQTLCKLNRPRSHYEDKLERYIQQYEEAKKAGDAQLVHKLRSNISNARAKLRYWDAHQDEAASMQAAQDKEAQLREYKHNRAAQIKKFREELKILHQRFIELSEAHGAKHPETLEAKAKWRNGVKLTNRWIDQHPATLIKDKNE